MANGKERHFEAVLLLKFLLEEYLLNSNSQVGDCVFEDMRCGVLFLISNGATRHSAGLMAVFSNHLERF